MSSQADALYKKQYDLFVKEAGEYGRTVFDFIVKDILPTLPQTDSFLDVGPGQGTFTLMLADYFKHVGVVETNTVYCQQVVKELLYRNKVVTACNGDWRYIQLGKQKFDLILCLHVLYHVHKDSWPTFIDNLTASLNPGGKAVIMLVDREGETGSLLFERLLDGQEDGYYAQDLTLCLSNMGQAYQQIPLNYHLPMQTRDDFFEMLHLMLNVNPEFKIKPDIEAIRKKTHLIEQYYKTESGMFQFYETSQAIIIKK